MLFLKHPNRDGWWECDKERMRLYNYMGGHCDFDEKFLSESECCEYESWHDLYNEKHFCPLEEDKWARDVWISPDGKYYNGNAHEVAAGYLCDIIYGLEDIDYGGDELESRGWCRATTSLMWEVRFDEWQGKKLTQKQYGALLNWCEAHKKKFPNGIMIKRT